MCYHFSGLFFSPLLCKDFKYIWIWIQQNLIGKLFAIRVFIECIREKGKYNWSSTSEENPHCDPEWNFVFNAIFIILGLFLVGVWGVHSDFWFLVAVTISFLIVQETIYLFRIVTPFTKVAFD